MSKSFFVATAIPYTNAKPHLGHALLFSYADVLARYHRLQGYDVCYATGTDEHGEKVLEKASQERLEPQAFVDRISGQFKQALQTLEISYTDFVRTTDAKHCRTAQLIWRNLKDYIVKRTFEGWYCVGCESYQTEVTYKNNQGSCPDHQRPYTRRQEENYFFRQSLFAEEIKDKILNKELVIQPPALAKEAISLIDNDLEDINISRLKKNLDWGIEVPDDPEQVIHVWFEALMNYITVLGYPDHENFAKYWPADVQIIGRDILKFHAITWPAMLLALKLPVYKKLYVHGLITVKGSKMSKSIGNIVDPIDLVNQYGLDAFRYFFLRHIPSYDNGDYSLDRFLTAYNNELVDQLGNLIHRLQTLVWQKLAGQIDLSGKTQMIKPEDGYHRSLAECRFDRALDFVFQQIQNLNRFLEEKQPWHLSDRKELSSVLNHAVVDLMQIGQLLAPFLPATAQLIKDIFQTSPISRPQKPPFEKHKI